MKQFLSISVVALILLMLSACVESIAGNPEQVTADYIQAIQTDDADTFFGLNHITARRLKYLAFGTDAEDKEALKLQVKLWKEWWRVSESDYDVTHRWNDRALFPPGAETTIGKAYQYKSVGSDRINSEYLKGLKTIVPVDVKYADKSLIFEGKKVASARFDCILGKIRSGKNVRIYSHDEQWYVASCLIDSDTVKYKN